MGKESIVEIPPGSGNQYRYEYDEGTGKTMYRGPVGDAPTISEADFMAAVGEVIPRPESSKNYDAIEKLDTRTIKKAIDAQIKENEEQLLLLEEADAHFQRYQGKFPSKRMETSFQKHLDEKWPGRYQVRKEEVAGMTYINIYPAGPTWLLEDRIARFFMAYDTQEVMTPQGLARGAYDHHRAFAREPWADPDRPYRQETSSNYGLWLDYQRNEELKRLKPLVGKAVRKYNAGAKSINDAQDMLYSPGDHGVPWPLRSFFTAYKEK